MELEVDVEPKQAPQKTAEQDSSCVLADAVVKEEPVFIKEEASSDQNASVLEADEVKNEFIDVKYETNFLQCFGDGNFSLEESPGVVESFVFSSRSDDLLADAPSRHHHLQGRESPEAATSQQDPHVKDFRTQGSQGSFMGNKDSDVEGFDVHANEGGNLDDFKGMPHVKIEIQSDWSSLCDLGTQQTCDFQIQKGKRKRRNRNENGIFRLDGFPAKKISKLDRETPKILKCDDVVKEEVQNDTFAMLFAGQLISNPNLDSSNLGISPKLEYDNPNLDRVSRNASSSNLLYPACEDTKPSSTSPKMSSTSAKMSSTSPKMSSTSPKMSSTSPKMSSTSPKMSSTSPKMSSTSRIAVNARRNGVCNGRKHERSGGYQCKLCNFSCNSVATFMSHSKQHTQETRTQAFQCRVCDFCCSDINVFLTHTKNVCKVVGEDVPASVRSRDAVQGKGPSPPCREAKNQVFCCEYCSFETHNSGFILRHIALHVKEEKNSGGFECSSCDYTCGDRDEFLRHVEAHGSHTRQRSQDLRNPSQAIAAANHQTSSETNGPDERFKKEPHQTSQNANSFRLEKSRIRVGSTRKSASLSTNGRQATHSVTMATGPGRVTNSAVVFVRQRGNIGVLVGSGDNVRGNTKYFSGTEVMNTCGTSLNSLASSTDACMNTSESRQQERGNKTYDHGGGVGNYVCSKCSYSCTNARTFRGHLSQCWCTDRQTRTTDDSFQCSHCSFKTKDTNWFLNHVKIHAC